MNASWLYSLLSLGLPPGRTDNDTLVICQFFNAAYILPSKSVTNAHSYELAGSLRAKREEDRSFTKVFYSNNE